MQAVHRLLLKVILRLVGVLKLDTSVLLTPPKFFIITFFFFFSGKLPGEVKKKRSFFYEKFAGRQQYNVSIKFNRCKITTINIKNETKTSE
jgi:hypothetical protein